MSTQHFTPPETVTIRSGPTSPADRQAYWTVKSNPDYHFLMARDAGSSDVEGLMTKRGAATRKRIIEAAADLVFLHGAARTSLDDVRAATGTSKSQLYHYFRDKDDLIRAVIDRQTERVLESQRADLQTLDSFAGLRRWRDNIVAQQRALGFVGGCPVGSLASELADASEPARSQLAGSFQRWQGLLAKGLGRMRDRGELRPEANPSELATAVMTALQGGLLLCQTSRSVKPLKLGLDMALRHVESYASTTE